VTEERHSTWDDIRSLGVLGRAWAVGVFAFSAARALIAWPTFGRYGVDPWVFLLLDLVTAVPYGLGQAITVKILRTPNRPARQAIPWGVVVAAAFLAPYAYIFAASGSMPALAYYGVLLWMVVFGLLAVLRIRRQVRAPIEEPADDTTVDLAPRAADAADPTAVPASSDSPSTRDSHHTP
jgi:hypothetical protein